MHAFALSTDISACLKPSLVMAAMKGSKEWDPIPKDDPVPASPKAEEEEEEGGRNAHSKPEYEKQCVTLIPVEAMAPKNRDVALAKVNQEKTFSHIKAWEENAKSKSLNKYQREIAKINAWENTKKAMAESKLKKSEEKLEKKKAEYIEWTKNEIAEVHKRAEEKRALAEAVKGEELLRSEEAAAKYKASGQVPKKMLCFGA